MRALIHSYKQLLVGFIIALVLSTIVLLFFNIDIVSLYKAMGQGIVGDWYRIAEVLLLMESILAAGSATAVSFKCGYINLGVEGQMIIGVLVASWIGTMDTFSFVYIPAIIFLGCLAGALWSLVPALLKVKLNVNDIVSTLMMNWIAYWLLDWATYFPLEDPTRYVVGSKPINGSAAFPRIYGRLHVGFFVVLACAIVMYYINNYSVFGYNLKITGSNPKAAEYAGINISKITCLAACIAGAIAALGGISVILGRDRMLNLHPTSNYGFYGTIACLISPGFSEIGLLLTSFILSCVIKGTDYAQRIIGLPTYIAIVTMGLIIFGILFNPLFIMLRSVISKSFKEKKKVIAQAV